jgi:Acetyltransferase (GNAT) family.
VYSYRTATPADEARIAALVAEGVGVPVEPEAVHAPVERLADPTADPYTLVATCEDGVVATASVSLDRDVGDVLEASLAAPSPSPATVGSAPDESVAHLAYAYVTPAHQSRGVGAELLCRLLAVAVRVGLSRAVVEVWEYDRECDTVDCACTVGFFSRSLPASIPAQRQAFDGSEGG